MGFGKKQEEPQVARLTATGVDVSVPYGKQVTSVEVTEVDGSEFVSVSLRDKPIVSNTLATVEVVRPNDPTTAEKPPFDPGIY